jgi:hypothetical protein
MLQLVIFKNRRLLYRPKAIEFPHLLSLAERPQSPSAQTIMRSLRPDRFNNPSLNSVHDIDNISSLSPNFDICGAYNPSIFRTQNPHTVKALPPTLFAPKAEPPLFVPLKCGKQPGKRPYSPKSTLPLSVKYNHFS